MMDISVWVTGMWRRDQVSCDASWLQTAEPEGRHSSEKDIDYHEVMTVAPVMLALTVCHTVCSGFYYLIGSSEQP